MNEESFKSKLKKIGNSGFVLVPMKIINKYKLEIGNELEFIIKINKESISNV
jgi:antitoxin component of MazEF toxin-antitoxin module